MHVLDQGCDQDWHEHLIHLAILMVLGDWGRRLQLDKVLESRGSGMNEGRLGRGSSDIPDLPTPSASAGPSRQTSFSQAPPGASSRMFDPSRLHRHADMQAGDAGDDYEDDELGQGTRQYTSSLL